MGSRLLVALLIAAVTVPTFGQAVSAGPEWENITYSNSAQCVAAAGDTIWVGTTGGLVQWSVATGDFVRHLAPEGFPDNSVAAVAIDTSGRPWIGLGTWNGGLAVLDRGTWTCWYFADGLATDWVTGLALDGAGRVWVGTVRGLSVLDDGGTVADKSDDRWATFASPDGLINESVNGVCVDASGRVWCATSGGVSVLDPNGTPLDKSDDVWAGFTSADGMLADATYGVTADSAGRIWFASKGGVSVVDIGTTVSEKSDDAWTTFGAGQGLPSSGNALAVAFDSAETAWISHQRGLVSLEGASTPFDRGDDVVTLFTAADGIIKSNVRALVFDDRGVAWCAVPSGGLDRFDAGGTPSDKSDDSWTAYTVEDWLPSSDVRCVQIEGDVTWVGSSAGLVAFSGDRVARFSVGSPLTVEQGPGGILWIGMTGGLAAFADGGTPFDPSDDAATHFSATDGLGDNYVEDVSVDVAGRVWCATSNGISVLDPAGTPLDKTDDRWASFTTADGLAGDRANAIVAEGGRRVWVVHESASVSALDYGATPFDKSDDAWALFGAGSPIGVGSGYSVAIDTAGIKWFGLCPGLFAFDDGGTLLDTTDDRWQRFDIGDCNPGIAIDAQGRKWVATGWTGVTMLNDGGTPFDASDDVVTNLTTADGLIDNRTQAIAASGNSVWIGTDGGLSQLMP
jgi:ligand-binding sensor domain-containing protein